MKTSVVLATALLLLISVAHLLRFVFQVKVVVGSVLVPQWMSVAGFAAMSGLACYLWYENRRTNPW